MQQSLWVLQKDIYKRESEGKGETGRKSEGKEGKRETQRRRREGGREG